MEIYRYEDPYCLNYVYQIFECHLKCYNQRILNNLDGNLKTNENIFAFEFFFFYSKNGIWMQMNMRDYPTLHLRHKSN